MLRAVPNRARLAAAAGLIGSLLAASPPSAAADNEDRRHRIDGWHQHRGRDDSEGHRKQVRRDGDRQSSGVSEQGHRWRGDGDRRRQARNEERWRPRDGDHWRRDHGRRHDDDHWRRDHGRRHDDDHWRRDHGWRHHDDRWRHHAWGPPGHWSPPGHRHGWWRRHDDDRRDWWGWRRPFFASRHYYEGPRFVVHSPYYCRPCNHWFQDRGLFHRHVCGHHYVPASRLGDVLGQVAWGFIFWGI